MLKGKETNGFYKEPCTKNCKVKEYWTTEHPEIGEQLNLSSVILCLGCINFVPGDHFIPVIDRGYKK